MASRVTSRADELLSLVHQQPGITRADAAKVLGLGTGAITELVGRLVDRELLSEESAPPSGSRGRPTTVLGAHPHGPVVVAVSIGFETWRVQVVEIGGAVLANRGGDHQGRGGAATLAAVAADVDRVVRRFPHRVRGIGVSAPGTVVGTILRQASYLEWNDLDLRPIWADAPVFVAGNDATLAAAAEYHRGAAVGAAVSVHLRLTAGVGGAVVDHGVTSVGASGAAGEFGHMPFGDPTLRCPCGARGCWGAAVDGAALARALGRPAPSRPDRYFTEVVAAARAGGTAEMGALEQVAVALGRGVAGLVNGLDPEVVTIGGLGVPLLELAQAPVLQAYTDGLMSFRRADPPPILVATLGDQAPLIGAAEQAWTTLWNSLVSP